MNFESRLRLVCAGLFAAFVAAIGPVLIAQAAAASGAPVPQTSTSEWGGSFLWAIVCSLMLDAWEKNPYLPGMSAYASKASRQLISLATAIGAAIGVHFAFDSAAGVLTVSGLMLSSVWQALGETVRQWLFQKYVYLSAVRRQKLDALGRAMPALLLVASFGLVGCGGKVPQIPSAPVIVDFADMNVHDATAYAVGVVTSSSVVVNRISKLEESARPMMPSSVSASLRAAIVSTSQGGKQLLDDIEKGLLDTWPKLRAAIDRYINTVRPLVEIIRTSGPTIKDKFAAVVEVLIEIAIGIAQPGAFAGCCQ